MTNFAKIREMSQLQIEPSSNWKAANLNSLLNYARNCPNLHNINKVQAFEDFFMSK